MSEKGFWLVWSKNGSMPRHEHESSRSAQTEAARLARLHHGERFYVLRATSYIVVNDITTVEFEDEPPF